ncbi:MAG TPA: hypothetical protein VN999_18105 [Thermoanaerobaculia bacterium]|nr:hypothetical protein [Thermoanaerobaculia bacterium]
MKRLIAPVVLVMGLSGLAALIGYTSKADTKLRFKLITRPDESGFLKFVLPRSLILVDVKHSLEEGEKLVASALPSDLAINGKQVLYSIMPINSWGVTTRLNVAYIPSSRIISSIGSEIEDTRAKSITTAAGIIVASRSLTSAGMHIALSLVPETMPIVIDPKLYELENGAHRRWVELPGNRRWSYRLDLGPLPVDAEKTEIFFRSDRVPTNLVPVTACRDATLYILRFEGARTDVERDRKIGQAWALALKIADPDYVLAMGLPAGGRISMHTGCGADVTSGKGEAGSTWDVIGEGMRQAAAIRKTYGAGGEGRK